MYNPEDNENRPESSSERYSIQPSKAQKIMRTIFGIIMIIIYVGMGVLLLINFFDWEQSIGMNIARIVVGIVLIIYGVWRAYRQYAGIDSRY